MWSNSETTPSLESLEIAASGLIADFIEDQLLCHMADSPMERLLWQGFLERFRKDSALRNEWIEKGQSKYR
jgi:hypothetical protein